MEAQPTVHIVDDEEPVRSGLQRLFVSLGMRVREYESAINFLDTFEDLGPGCGIVDVRMPDMNGLELLGAMGRQRIHLPVIMITGQADIPLAVHAIKSGAMNFLEKPFRQQDLLDCVTDAIAKDQRRHALLAERSSTISRFSLLTRRERDVMNGLVAGETAEHIGMHLGLSAKTVYTHRGRILLKLRVSSIAELTRLAMTAESADSDGSSGSVIKMAEATNNHELVSSSRR